MGKLRAQTGGRTLCILYYLCTKSGQNWHLKSGYVMGIYVIYSIWKGFQKSCFQGKVVSGKNNFLGISALMHVTQVRYEV